MIIGVIGGGQLGRMLALAGIPLGISFRFFDPAEDPPAKDLGGVMRASYSDAAALRRFAARCDLITYELEHFPLAAARTAAECAPIYPPPAALEIGQDRIREKRLFADLSIPTAKNRPVGSAAELRAALEEMGTPAIVKTTQLGYDGKGQWRAGSVEQSAAIWQSARGAAIIVEELITFEREVSLVLVRDRSGTSAAYPLVENVHRSGILVRSTAAEAARHDPLQAQAFEYVRRIADQLDYVGVLVVEFFDRGGQLIANELAPRVHNSGHWTIEGSCTSQFENHLRAVAGLPIGSTGSAPLTVMYNLIGREPDCAALLSLAHTHLHLYGKSARPGRKIGHVTISGTDATETERIAAAAEKVIENDYGS